MTPENSTTQNRIAFGLIAAVFAGLFLLLPYATGYGTERKPIAYWLWYFWRSPEWQHGALVPVIIGVIVWKMRSAIKSLPMRGHAGGMALIILALILFLAGHRSNLYYLGYASCHLLVIGAVWWIGGTRWLSKLAFPIGFLIFMWPLYFLESQIGFPLRMLMTNVSSFILNIFGVDHLKLGTAIVSAPDTVAGLEKGQRFALEVANPCSGIRSLFALMMIGGLYGYLALTKPWHWIVMCLSAIPFAVAGNVVRILLLTFGSMAVGSEVAVGKNGSTSTFHFVAGIAVFLVAAGGMFLFGKFLASRSKAKPVAEDPVVIDQSHVNAS